MEIGRLQTPLKITTKCLCSGPSRVSDFCVQLTSLLSSNRAPTHAGDHCRPHRYAQHKMLPIVTAVAWRGLSVIK